ncbi:hypothetical protein ACFVQB_14745 [Paenibacillus sp. NPDC057886]|uniref:hypothetical protein n=1 Tax=Paenibacillus sp. NPDC057886 TaxID=3346270 RepID=UPI00369D03FB
MCYSILQEQETGEYLVSIVSAEKGLWHKLESLENEIDKAWIEHKLSSGSDYAVYKVYGQNADKLIMKVESLLEKC